MKLLFKILVLILLADAASAQSCADIFAKRPKPEYELALENGSMPIKSIRYGGFNNVYQVSAMQVMAADIARIVETIPDISIIVDKSLFDEITTQNKIKPSVVKSRIVVSSYQAPDVWVRDWSKPLVDGRILFPSNRYRFDELRDHHAAEINKDIKASKERMTQAGFVTDRANLPFEGGDVVVGERHIFVGRNVIDVAREMYPRLNTSQIAEMYSKKFGKEVVVLNTSMDSRDGVEYHADLKISVVKNKRTGAEEIMLNSPVRFLEILTGKKIADKMTEHDLEVELDAVIEQAQLRNVHITADIVERSFVNLVQQLNRHQLKQFIENYYHTRHELESLGYKINDLPGMLYNYAPKNNLHHINYANVVLGEGYALVPRYGIPLFESRVLALYKELGYKVIWMDSAIPLALDRGGPRCACEVYYESP